MASKTWHVYSKCQRIHPQQNIFIIKKFIQMNILYYKSIKRWNFFLETYFYMLYDFLRPSVHLVGEFYLYFHKKNNYSVNSVWHNLLSPWFWCIRCSPGGFLGLGKQAILWDFEYFGSENAPIVGYPEGKILVIDKICLNLNEIKF